MSRIVEFVKKKWYLFLIALIFILIFLNKYIFNQKTEELIFINPEVRDLTQSLEVSGIIDAKKKARLRFLAGGKVTYIGALEGEEVSKWQTIATIDTSTLQKQKTASLNTYEQSRLSWEDTLEANGDLDLTDTEQRSEDRGQLTLDNTVLNVEIADIAIRNSALYAPFAGLLTYSPTNITGVQLAATDYFEVVDPESLVFKATVDETDLSLLSKGQQALIDLDAYDEEDLSSYINYISYLSSETSTGTVFLIEFPLENLSIEKYRLGMSGDVKIILEKKAAVLSLPIETLREEDNQYFVDIKADNAEGYQVRQIEIGLETDDFIEILTGLSEGDQVLMPE